LSNKGTRTERELFNKLWEKGYGVMRSPASGGARKHQQPDILFSDGDMLFAVECKSTSKKRVYIEKKEIKDLLEFCKRFGSMALIGLRFDREDWVIIDPGNLVDTGGKNFRADKERAMKKGIDLEKF
jgi:Holliday junction resolvase